MIRSPLGRSHSPVCRLKLYLRLMAGSCSFLKRYNPSFSGELLSGGVALMPTFLPVASTGPHGAPGPLHYECPPLGLMEHRWTGCVREQMTWGTTLLLCMLQQRCGQMDSGLCIHDVAVTPHHHFCLPFT
jgi:hypothetical protein